MSGGSLSGGSSAFASDLVGAQTTEAEVVADLAREAGIPRSLDLAVPQALIVPDHSSVVIPDVSAWRERPVRKTGTYRPATADSFIDYVSLHQTEDTTVWVHPSSGLVTAVIDDSGSEQPGYGQHRAVLQLAFTPEWLYWERLDKRLMSQDEFAEHIEGGLKEIQEPLAADMLEIAQSFHATVGATFSSSKRLHSGEQQLEYNEEVKATAGTKGNLSVPTTITLGIAPFLSEQPYKIEARLRFRLNGGNLQLGYILDRPEDVKRAALEDVAGKLAGAFKNTYVGEAPAA